MFKSWDQSLTWYLSRVIELLLHFKQLIAKKSQFMVGQRKLTSLILCMFLLQINESLAGSAEGGLLEMDFEELLKVPVVTVSNTSESVSEAPAKIIVISGEQLIKHGYKDLSHVLTLLPGMDIVRPYSDNYFINRWRGIRHNIGSSHILLVDGQELNHLYFSETEVLAALPIHQVARIEIVYGPASAVYGANAFVGVINVITRHGARGSEHRGSVIVGTHNSKIFDNFYAEQLEDWRFSFGLRIERGELDDSHINSFEWTQQQYYSDRQLWGEFLDLPQYGAFKSEIKNHGVDIRLSHSSHQFAYQQFRLASGYGTKYTADSVQNNDIWIEQDEVVNWQWQVHSGKDFKWTSTLRWRKSSVEDASDFLEGYNVDNAGLSTRVLDYSLWSAPNYSWKLEQKFDFNVSQDWFFNGGLDYQRKSLNKAYITSFGPSLPVGLVDITSYPFPPRPSDNQIADNRKRINESGLYFLSRYILEESSDATQSISFGLRADNQTAFGFDKVLRAGYTARWSNWLFKVLYGESFEEPPARLLYGGWQGAGSDPDLDPQQGETYEVVVEYVKDYFKWSANGYQIYYDSLFRSVAGGAVNSGDGRVSGIDLSASLRFFPELIDEVNWSTNLTYIESQERMDASSPWMDVGDIAPVRWSNELSFQMSDSWFVYLSHLWAKNRYTVATNPVREVSGYSVYNLNLRYQFPDSEAVVSLGVNNLTDKIYFHPGVRQANSGNSPGSFNNLGEWQGSGGFYNSLLPQPGREVLLSFTWRY